MTHEELLAEINKELEITHWEAWHEGARALRAVVELHKPWDGTRLNPDQSFNGPWCTHCEEVYDGSIKYPCPTIQAIETELK